MENLKKKNKDLLEKVKKQRWSTSGKGEGKEGEEWRPALPFPYSWLLSEC